MDYDVITIGAGHNTLVTSAYLAQAGYRVGVFERRDVVGGAAATEEVIPGYRFDLGGSAHILIRLTPIVQELKLDRYGLHYIELDPLFFAPFPDGDAVFIYRDVEQTIHHLETKFPGQGEAYRRFLDDWRDFSLTIRDVFLSTPSPFELGKRMIRGRSTRLPWRDALQYILQPYGDVVCDYFSEEKLRAMLVWMAAQSGPPPTAPLTGPFVLWHPLYHEGGIARPRGGSGMLTQALQRHVEAHGGHVHTSPWRACRPRLRAPWCAGPARRPPVHVRAPRGSPLQGPPVGKLLPPEHRPPASRRLRVGNGFGAAVRLALRGPIAYAAHPGRDARVALQLLCRDTAQVSGISPTAAGAAPARLLLFCFGRRDGYLPLSQTGSAE